MKRVVGVEDFKECVENAKNRGKWNAWYEYFLKYRDVFERIIKYLYMTEINKIRPLVEGLDFDMALRNAEKFLREDGINRVSTLISMCEKLCRPEGEYTVYLLIDLGNIDGTSLPAENPFLFFGLELYVSPKQLEYLVPHEYNHLVRISVFKDEMMKSSQLTVKELVIFEGLATLFPAVLWGKEIGPLSIIDAGMMSKDAAEYCLKNESNLMNELFSIWDEKLTRELLGKYFAGTSDGWREGRPAKIAYYVGSRIVGDLLKRGHNICELTKKPAEEILSLWKI